MGRYRTKAAILVAAPLLTLPLLGAWESTTIARTAWAAALIAIFWATEVVPIAVTSLFPIFLFPALGVVRAEHISRNYFKDKIVLFFGGLVVAAALEAVHLQKRIALRVLMLFGARPPRLLLGFMCSTAFISMWMSNTATAAMMMPIAEAVLHQLGTSVTPADGGQAEVRFSRLGKALVLSIAYAANIGGLATLTGTGPNLVLAGDVAALYPAGPGVGFASWMLFAFPLAVVLLAAAWALINGVFLRDAAGLYEPSLVASQLRSQYDALGPIGWREGCVLADFVTLALLWITREPKFVPGWGAWFREEYVTDGTVAAFMAVLLFLLPAQPPELPSFPSFALGRTSVAPSAKAGAKPDALPATPSSAAVELTAVECLPSDGSAEPPTHVRPARRRVCAGVGKRRLLASDALASTTAVGDGAACGGAEGKGGAAPAAAAPPHSTLLLDWSEVQRTLPWGVILLLGGGFALADACEVSGLSNEIGESLKGLGALPEPVVVFLLLIITSCTTAVTSNVATASIFVPVASSLAESMSIHPLVLMVPITLTCSLAFVLPVSTPPNAMAFASGRLEVSDMIKLGLCMNLIGIFVVMGFLYTTGSVIFDVGDDIPDWVLAAWGSKTGDGDAGTGERM